MVDRGQQLGKDRVEVKIGGMVHSNWTTYDIDSNLLVPADAWHVTLSTNGARGSLPAEIAPGASVEVRVLRSDATAPAAQTVLMGTLDARSVRVDRSGTHIELHGRDLAAVLLDCSAPIFTRQTIDLEQVITNIVRELGIVRHRIDAEPRRRLRQKVAIEPGELAWDALRRAAEAEGLWPWFEPDGTLIVGGPDEGGVPVDTLRLGREGGSNVTELELQRSIVGRFSEVTVLGQSVAHGVGDGEQDGKHRVRAKVLDTGVIANRPHVLMDHEANTKAIAEAKGRKFIGDARLQGFSLQATVPGHRTASGLLWKPGQRVGVVSEPHGINGTFFLMGRRFTCDRHSGQQTHLLLKEDGVWALDAHPSRRKHSRGKGSQKGKIVDLPVESQ